MSTALVSTYEFNEHYRVSSIGSSGPSASNSQQHHHHQQQREVLTSAISKPINGDRVTVRGGGHYLERKNTFPGCLLDSSHIVQQQQQQQQQQFRNQQQQQQLNCGIDSSLQSLRPRLASSSAAQNGISTPGNVLANMQQKAAAVTAMSQQQQHQPDGGLVNGSGPVPNGHMTLCQTMSVNVLGSQPKLSAEHKKLDRSMSEPAEKPQRQLSQANSSRYKTELCRPFEENGTCKYGDKCQFAHGFHELRNLQRHPKYKTELCRTFHTTGFCPYGPRCHFIHNSDMDTGKKSVMSTLQQQQTGLGSNATSNGSGGGRSHQTQEQRNAAATGAAAAPSTRASTGGSSQAKATNNINEMLLNGINSAMKSIVKQASSSVSPPHGIPLRPKALSFGSFSLGSSGDLSPPSSQSGSPTSINSFFNEETFGFSSFNHHSHLHQQNSLSDNHGGNQGSGAFSFSPPGFVSIMESRGSQRTMSEQSSQSQSDSSSSSSSSVHSALQSVLDLVSPNGMGSRYDAQQHHHHQHNSSSSQSESGNSCASSGIGSASPTPASGLSYPAAPSSPVDSLGSELDMLSMGGSSPVPSSSPTPVSSSNGQLPRLPIFTRFANNGNSSGNNNHNSNNSQRCGVQD